MTTKQIAEDLQNFRLNGISWEEMELHDKCVTLSFHHVGTWIHDEERGREQEQEGDMDWREDDDHMILAPGQMKSIYTDILSWCKPKSWFDQVTFSVEPSEKCWLNVSIQLKP